MTFTQTGLWVVLFGMYFFIISSQMMVLIPEMCGQRFCLANAILVHWFALMSVAWTVVQTVRIVQLTRYPEEYGRREPIPGDTYGGFRIRAWLAATVLPCLFPFLASMPHFSDTLATIVGGYGYGNHEKWCWLDGDHSWIPWVTFITPLSIAGVLNISAVLFYAFTSKKRQKKLSIPYTRAAAQPDTVKQKVHGIIITTGLMGLIWLGLWLALLSCYVDEILQYVFVLLLTVACGSQAVYIIIFQAIIPEKRKKRSVRSFSSLSGTISAQLHDTTAPILIGRPDKDYFLELLVHHYRDDSPDFIPKWQIWGSKRDYAGFLGSNLWIYVVAEYATDSQFALTFQAHHGDTCNRTSIDLDNIVTEAAVPAACPFDESEIFIVTSTAAVVDNATEEIPASTIPPTSITIGPITSSSTITEDTTTTTPDLTTSSSTITEDTTTTTPDLTTSSSIITEDTTTTTPDLTTSSSIITEDTTTTTPDLTTTSSTITEDATTFTPVPTTTPTTVTEDPATSPGPFLDGASGVIQSVLSAELKNVTNKESYANETEYYVHSADNVLNTLKSGVSNGSRKLSFEDIVATSKFFEELAGTNVTADLPEGAQKDAIKTLLQITDEIVSAEESGKLATSVVGDGGQDAAAAIYEALEDMYNSLPPAEEPYVFNDTTCVAFVNVVEINGSSRFDDLKFRTTMDITGFGQGTLTLGDDNENATSVATIAFKEDVLREAFEELKQTANETSAKFAFSLSAMPAFKFARSIPLNEVRERSSPLVLLASVGISLKRKDVITIRHNIDQLFNYPSGAKRHHECIFLDYTSKKWEKDGCRLSAKYPKWDSTIVECTCDHLTPFSLLLTLCGSLSNSFAPNDESFTFDLVVVTLGTTIVSAVCCLIALITIIMKAWRRKVIFDEMTFTQTGLWIVLFGMYFFIISSQMMVLIPEMCGQKFCLANAILVHWFALMSVAWTVVQTVRILRLTRYPEEYGREYIPGSSYRIFRIKAWLIATAIPCVFPFLASLPHLSENFALFVGGYGYANHEKWCWLDGDHSWIPWVTFIAPLSTAGILNVSAVVFYVFTTKKRQKELSIPYKRAITHADPVRRKVHGIIITTGLMGLIWLCLWLALLSCYVHETVQYVFVLLLTVACGSQAVYIIIFQAIIPERRPKRSLRSFSSLSGTLSGISTVPQSDHAPVEHVERGLCDLWVLCCCFRCT
ncbi:adhesion G protein-coupled receptor L3-like [Paramacrobiotus metropolitanus]|uniref:adhesion G protein-coupled receptor L3-like n=1 Tax=Paramacrobiotus metropolitanus TaxID=2943436 RepID=UPI0024460A19|nr:adhesion G protein-coupled receptor L3-like [Paramacrobiotus metropolitanus]